MSRSPARPPRICATPGCPNPQPCAEHPPGGWSTDRERTRAVSGRAWRETRARILRRDPWCYVCAKSRSVEVDHVVPRAEGGSLDDGNFRGICVPCHRVKSREEATRGRRRASRE